jgi:hypothetical protein
MSKHTPGPWRVGTHREIIAANGDVLTDSLYSGDCGIEGADANADRLVACLNACEGIADPSVVPHALGFLERLVNCPGLGFTDQATGETWHDQLQALLVRVEGRK